MYLAASSLLWEDEEPDVEAFEEKAQVLLSALPWAFMGEHEPQGAFT